MVASTYSSVFLLFSTSSSLRQAVSIRCSPFSCIIVIYSKRERRRFAEMSLPPRCERLIRLIWHIVQNISLDRLHWCSGGFRNPLLDTMCYLVLRMLVLHRGLSKCIQHCWSSLPANDLYVPHPAICGNANWFVKSSLRIPLHITWPRYCSICAQ